MKTLGTFLLAVALCVGCSKPADDHKGHDHSKHKPAATEAGIPAALRDPARLWCKEHNRYEDRCWLCHPDQQDKKRAYCDEHGLYEDECFLCHPELKPQKPQAKRLMCKEHNVPEDECGICHPELASKGNVKVRLPSTESATLVGIQTATPTTGAMADGIECYAELAFNQNKLAHLTTPVGGIIQEVLVDLGDKVTEGQACARIWSAQIAEAVAKATLARQTVERERKLRADNISTAKELQEAEAAFQTASQQLKPFDFTEVPAETATLELRAPFAGEIVERNAVRGAQVEAGKALYTLADRSTMWAMLNLPEAALARVRVGQPVELSVDSLTGQVFTGTLTWVSAEVDERTRLARGRAEIPNPAGVLRARMFARARILTRETNSALLLPASAVQPVDGKPLVFVKIADDLYEARAVQLGATHNGQVEVLAGIQSGDVVVVAHAFTVKSQLLISRLGAGCADD
ncbi:MAG: efflux RND transporter periplasmic adaptor subunit [Verrucomicrobiota bacterium]